MSTEQSLSESLAPVAVDASSRLIVDLARRVASTDCTVLIVGESGTGKEVLARLIHRASPRAGKRLHRRQLRGHPREHARSDAVRLRDAAPSPARHNAHAGKFEQAQGGTLLLDEITEMPLALQAKLLRVLQEREVERIGGSEPMPLDVRVIATTNRMLRAEVAAGRFREDLYYRLNVFPLAVNPLRERRDDILPLATHLLQLRARPGKRIPALSADVAHLLLTYPGPATCASSTTCCSARWCWSKARSSRPSTSCSRSSRRSSTARRPPTARRLHQTMERAERDVILEALRAANGSRREVAEKLGISPRTLRYKLARIRNAGIDVPAA